jgi:hypothetical protein
MFLHSSVTHVPGIYPSHQLVGGFVLNHPKVSGKRPRHGLGSSARSPTAAADGPR